MKKEEGPQHLWVDKESSDSLSLLAVLLSLSLPRVGFQL